MEAVIFHEMMPVKYRNTNSENCPSPEDRKRMNKDGEIWENGFVASRTIHGAYVVVRESCGYSFRETHDKLKFL